MASGDRGAGTEVRCGCPVPVPRPDSCGACDDGLGQLRPEATNQDAHNSSLRKYGFEEELRLQGAEALQ